MSSHHPVICVQSRDGWCATLTANDEPEQPFIREPTGSVKPIRERRRQ